jgi:hypothetical protein
MLISIAPSISHRERAIAFPTFQKCYNPPANNFKLLTMPAKDLFHDAVRCGLEKEGWQITNDPLHLRVGKIDMYVDLGAEKVLVAEKENRKIAVEIKSFLRTSTITEFYLALEQFIPYRIALEELEPDRILYLAIPVDVYELFFQQAFIQKVLAREQVKLIVYDGDRPGSALWKSAKIWG